MTLEYKKKRNYNAFLAPQIIYYTIIYDISNCLVFEIDEMAAILDFTLPRI